jgi:ketosteroid isomerase-like protein
VQIVREFWARMQSNDFASVAGVLAPDFVLEWPQSRERIRGAERFVRMNAEYPAHGPWRFTIHRIVGDEREAVSDVSITDGVQQARAISFFDVADGRVQRLVEYCRSPTTRRPTGPTWWSRWTEGASCGCARICCRHDARHYPRCLTPIVSGAGARHPLASRSVWQLTANEAARRQEVPGTSGHRPAYRRSAARGVRHRS